MFRYAIIGTLGVFGWPIAYPYTKPIKEYLAKVPGVLPPTAKFELDAILLGTKLFTFGSFAPKKNASLEALKLCLIVKNETTRKCRTLNLLTVFQPS
mmetsp:Transcript_5380/g.6274  ORF Transcript_5380/g.6274 Transcript_5380/m.6274 type:complete len:97 (+) Transcript_5380:694-984(+)